MQAVRWLFLTLILTSAITVHAQNRDRNKMVLNDRERVVEDGYWIYNNLDKGLEQAKEVWKAGAGGFFAASPAKLVRSSMNRSWRKIPLFVNI